MRFAFDTLAEVREAADQGAATCRRASQGHCLASCACPTCHARRLLLEAAQRLAGLDRPELEEDR